MVRKRRCRRRVRLPLSRLWPADRAGARAGGLYAGPAARNGRWTADARRTATRDDPWLWLCPTRHECGAPWAGDGCAACRPGYGRADVRASFGQAGRDGWPASSCGTRYGNAGWAWNGDAWGTRVSECTPNGSHVDGRPADEAGRDGWSASSCGTRYGNAWWAWTRDAWGAGVCGCSADGFHVDGRPVADEAGRDGRRSAPASAGQFWQRASPGPTGAGAGRSHTTDVWRPWDGAAPYGTNGAGEGG